MEHRDLFDDDYEPPEAKHSGFGIASFAIAIAAALLEFVLVATAGVLEASTKGGIDENSPLAILLGLAVIGGLLVALVGIGLGIAGLCQSRRKRVFAVLGMIMNPVVLFGVLGVMVLGLIAG